MNVKRYVTLRYVTVRYGSKRTDQRYYVTVFYVTLREGGKHALRCRASPYTHMGTSQYVHERASTYGGNRA